MKKSWRCPKCQGARIGYLEKVMDQDDQHDRGRMIGSAITSSVLGIGVGQNVGLVEAFVCTECGYFEEYIKDPHLIPWDQVVGFRWCVAAPQST